MIDPIYQVPLLKAIAVTIVQPFTVTAGLVSEALGESFVSVLRWNML